MELLVNTLLAWNQSDRPERLERILWRNVQSNQLVVIQIGRSQKGAAGMPGWRLAEEVERALANGNARIVKEERSAAYGEPEELIAESARRRRDRAWEMIEPIVKSPPEDLFDREQRGHLVQTQLKKYPNQRQKIYSALKRYWMGGQVPNALLPHYAACGRGPHRAGERKRGRPCRVVEKRGINVEAKVKARLLAGFASHRRLGDWRSIYQATMEQCFTAETRSQDGTLVPVLLPANERPTLGQFKYWCRRDLDIGNLKLKNAGKRERELRHRPLLGDPLERILGPGSLYQIDSTVADVYLVSVLCRQWVIGRPVLYLVIDAFSRLIVGYYLTLENASYFTAALALENAATDKVNYCKRYGITIETDEWPSHHLCSALLADRAELLGKQADALCRCLGVTIQNTSPYRADLKGLVERRFQIANDDLIHWLPGNTATPRERGVRDHRFDAILTLDEFRKLVIRWILEYNKDLLEYPVSKAMLRDQVRPIPIELWKWGIRNCGGQLRAANQESLRLNLLPRDEAVITRSGFRFRNLHYACDSSEALRLFEAATVNPRMRIPISFDPRDCSLIYMHIPGPTFRFEPCHLCRADRPRFEHCSFMDSDRFFLEKKKQETQFSPVRQQNRAELDAWVAQEVEKARERTRDATQGRRVSAKDLRAHRQLELQEQHKRERAELRSKRKDKEQEDSMAAVSAVHASSMPQDPFLRVLQGAANDSPRLE